MNIFKMIEIFFILAAVVGGPLLAVMVVPAIARRFLKSARWPGESPPSEPDDAKAAELEHLSQRVAELEERVDSTERLLARQRDAALPKPGS